MGQKENPHKPQASVYFFLSPIGCFGYPFLTRSHVVILHVLRSVYEPPLFIPTRFAKRPLEAGHRPPWAAGDVLFFSKTCNDVVVKSFIVNIQLYIKIYKYNIVYILSGEK